MSQKMWEDGKVDRKYQKYCFSNIKYKYLYICKNIYNVGGILVEASRERMGFVQSPKGPGIKVPFYLGAI